MNIQYLLLLLSFIDIILLIISCYILFSQKYPRFTNAGWLIAILFIPIIGSLSFYFFRIRQKVNTHCSKHSKVKFVNNNIQTTKRVVILEEYQTLCHVGLANHFASYDNKISELDIQQDSFFIEDLLSKINQAQHIICIIQYIFNGDIADKIIHALIKASNRGVKVFLLIDRIGSSLQNPFSKRLRKLKNLPFSVHIAWPKRLDNLRLISVRIHSKVAYIDHKYAWLGSHNIRDEALTGQGDKNRTVHNITLRQTGDAVWQVGRYIELLWQEISNEEIIVVNNENSIISESQQNLSRVIFRNNDLYKESLRNLIFAAINQAKAHCLIWTPYAFIPIDIKTAILSAIQRGVNVEILLPRKTDYRFIDYAFSNNIKELLDMGISVFVSDGLFDHSKAIIIDNWVMIGSSNFSYRSFLTNYEVNFEIIDHKLATKLASMFHSKKSEQLTSETYKIGIIKRIISNIFNLPITLF